MDGPGAHDESTEVVHLSRWRALLARSRAPQKRMEALLAAPGAAALVRELPDEDLYFLVRSVGLGDATELIGLASPEQIRTCLDLDLWRRDRVDRDRVVPWLELLETIGGARLAAAMRTLDLELLAWLVRRHARVYDRSLEEAPPPDTNRTVVETPDGFYWLEFTSPDVRVTALVARVFDQLFKIDPDRAAHVVREARWSHAAELEEAAYVWRTGRLADIGFVEHYEALEVYREIDPGASPTPRVPLGRADEPAVLPVTFAESLSEQGFLGRVLATIDDPAVLGGLADGLVALMNRVLAADLIDPGEQQQVRETSERVRDTLSLGLEHVAGGSVEAARTALAQLAFLTIFRIGYSLTTALAGRARRLRERGVDDPDLLPLLECRPLCPRSIDVPPLAGQRPFRAVADVQAVAARLTALER